MKWFNVVFCMLFIVTGCSSEGNDKEIVLSEKNTVDEMREEESQEINEEAQGLNEVEKEIHEEEIIAKDEGPIEEDQSIHRKYKLNPSNFLIQPLSEDINDQVVLLTIDDAPEHYGAEMAQILSDLNVNAIFFINGIFVNKDSGKEQLKKIHELGFEVGNHTMSHKNLSKLSPEEQRKEIVDLNNLIEEITGERPRFFRAPFGVNTDISKQVVEEEGMQWMNWTYGYDYFQEYMDAVSLAEIMVNAPELIKGANLLMHDRKWTKEALEDIVNGLRGKGYEFVDPKEIK